LVVVKKPDPASGGGSGFLTIDHLQADRAADWPRQADFEAVAPDSLAAAKAVAYLLNRKKSSGLFQSWKEEGGGLSSEPEEKQRAVPILERRNSRESAFVRPGAHPDCA
jgi:hypothetical protein